MQDSFRRVGAAALLGAVICLSAGQAQAIQCAIFARAVTGLELSGDAWQWWNHASGTYARGNVPKPGAVLVFMRSAPMRHGHVSVVRRVVSSREILVDHANWATRGAVARNVAVMDDSPNNDWSSVRVSMGAGYGRTNPTYGFIYEAAASTNVLEAANRASDIASQTAGDRDEVIDSTPRHRNHRWIKLAIGRASLSLHGRSVWARQAPVNYRSATLASFEPESRSARRGHATAAALVTTKPAVANTASRHDVAAPRARTVAAKSTTPRHDAKKHGPAVAAAAGGKHKTHKG